jgi:sulfopyruvate decarboxylase subunit beta
MIRYECFEWLAPLMTDELVVTSLSGQRVEWGYLSNREADLMLGSMGNALAVALGLALALPHRKVIAFESDGSLLLSLFNLPTLANANPPNLAIFVFDNEVYSGTRISYPTATAGKTDLAAVAKGSGVDYTVTVRDIDAFKREAMAVLKEDGLRFIVCKVVESVGHRKIQRTNLDLLENKYRFVRYLERTEGKPIFVGRG